MMNYFKQNHLSILIILWLVVSAIIPMSAPATFGVSDVSSITNPFWFKEYVKIGLNGGSINEMKSTTCTLKTYELPLEASSTDAFYCANTGVASGDQVYVSLPSDNASTFGGFQVSYTKASTTPDGAGIEVGIYNATGAATSTFPAATTSAQVLTIDN